MKIIVIGSIAAGVSAAAKLAAGGTGARIVVYEKSAFYSCGGCGLPHYLSESLAELNRAIHAKQEELAAQQIEAHLRHEVTAIDAAARTITVCELASGRTFTDRYDKLVLAMGSSNRIPQVPGCERVGVQTLKSVEDLLFLKEYTRTPYVRDIVILGGSYSGLEIAKAFLKMGRKVRVIEKERQLLPCFDAEVGAKIQQALEAEGVIFHLGETATAFPGQSFIEKVQTNRGSYDCDLCIAAIGVTPNTALAAAAGVATDKDGLIPVGDGLETNLPGIYAVGDCARRTGAAQRTSSLRAGLEIARTGLTEAEARAAGLHVKSVIATGNDRPGICPGANKVSIKLVYEAATRRVVGAQAWGKKNAAARVGAIAVAVAAGMTVEELAKVDFVYSSASCSIWDPIQIACNAAK